MGNNINEDALSDTYQYAWSKDSDLSLHDFLKKYKPSMVQNDGTKPWIWVRGGPPSKEDEGEEKAVEEATILLREVTKNVEDIKNDSSIPTRSNKKTGAKSKKEVREEAQVNATQKLGEISVRNGYVSGKWLIFSPSEKVDMIWTSLATSLAEGPLASTSAYLAKVATCPQSEAPNYQHLICVYMPDVYDKAAVTEVMKVLLRKHGCNLSGVKSNLYTVIGLDSKHPSGVQSTVWKNKELLKEAEIKEMKDAFFADVNAAKVVPKPTVTADNKDGASASPTKVKPKPKPKKKANADPFASDDDDDAEVKSKSTSSKPKSSTLKRAKETDDEDERGDNGPKRKVVKSS